MTVAYNSPSFTSTATGMVFDLDFGNAPLIRMNNATLADIRGLKAGQDGQTVTIVSVGAGQVTLAHQSTTELTVPNRLTNFVTSGPTPLAPGSGTATYQYDATATAWRLIAHVQGGFLNVPYNAGDYACDVGSWVVEAGDLSTYKYLIVGRSMLIAFTIISSTLTSTPSYCTIKMPSSYLPLNGEARVSIIVQNSSNTVGMLRAVAASNSLIVYKDPSGSNFVAQTNAFQVFGQFQVELQ